MKLVNQRFDYDCSIAASAMWLDVSYDEVFNAASSLGFNRSNDSKRGFSTGEIHYVLKKFNVNAFMIDEAYGGVDGILSLPSLNSQGGSHAVFYKDYKVYDPQTNREGKLAYPQELTFFPTTFKLTLNLNHAYSLQMAEHWLSSKQKTLKNAREDFFKINKENK